MARILVVEDESIVALDIQHRLHKLGYEVPTLVASGEEALEEVTASPPDLVLMDVMLAGSLDGVETAEIIRNQYNVPVVFLTAYSDDSTLQRAKVSGPLGYILKPFKEKELHSTIEVVLYRHEIEEKLKKAHDELELRVRERTAELATVNEELKREVHERERAELALQRRFAQLQTLFELSNSISRASGVEEVCRQVLNALTSKHQGNRAAVRLMDDDGMMRFRASSNLSDVYRQELEQRTAWPYEATDPQPVLLTESGAGSSSHPLRQVDLDEGIHSIACVPLVYSDQLLGELTIYYDQAHEFETEEVRLFQTMGRHIAFVLERKRAEEENVELETQLRRSQKMEALGLLAGGVAHDFNNMLTIITGYSELVLNCLGPDDPLARDITSIKEAGERAATLTSHLLAFSRRQVLQFKVLDLNRVVQRTDQMLRRIIGEDVELRCQLDGDLRYVKADPAQVEQVLLNLVINARDAMPRGGKLTIETSNAELDEAYVRIHVNVTPGPYVRLRVSDTGEGMSEDILSRIFEPFFTTKPTGKGTGLGLSTVYGIVQQTSGHVDVFSRPREGTRFDIFLPQAEGTPEAEGEMPITEEALRGSEIILLVEDESVVRKLAYRVLRDHGYTVLEARKGDEALVLAELHEGPIHLLLTDVVMPEMSGREVAQHLLPLRPEIKVLYMSGYTDDTVLRHGVEESEVPFLQKPFTPEVLMAKVREVLNQHASDRAPHSP